MAKYLELRCCKANVARGRNDRVTLEEKPDGTFLKKQNRIGDRINVRRYSYPMDQWDIEVDKLLSQGFEIVNTEKMVSKTLSDANAPSEVEKPLSDQEVQEILDYLRSFAKEKMTQTFIVRAEDIKDEDINAAAEILKKLLESKDSMSVPAFNQMLDRLHMKVPRNIPNVRKDHVTSKEQYQDKLQKEQDIFDFMVDQVHRLRNDSEQVVQTGQTVLERYGIDMWAATPEEFNFVKKKMTNSGDRVTRVWKVSNKKTEKYFDNYCKKYELGEYCKKPFDTKTPQGEAHNGVAELFHGSGTENWFSIFTGGLWLKPELLGARICGKAFGHGIYFAPLAQKSIGYTSSCGSYWAKGNEKRGYMAIFKVATGEVYDIYSEGQGVPDNYNQLQTKHKKHADCTWAMSKRTNGSSYLMNEEVIVYTDGSTREDQKDVSEDNKLSQCTIEYLIEFSA